MDNALKKKLITVGIAIALAAGAWYTWQKYKGGKDDGALLHGNGRIEATEVDVATKLAGRVDNILVSEGAFVKAGQVLATMQVQTLNAQLREAKAQRQQTLAAVASAQAQVVMRQSDKTAQLARMRQAEAEFDAAKRRLARSETLTRKVQPRCRRWTTTVLARAAPKPRLPLCRRRPIRPMPPSPPHACRSPARSPRSKPSMPRWSASRPKSTTAS